MSEENVEIVRAGYEALERRGHGGLARAVSTPTRIEDPEVGRNRGLHRRDAVMR